MSYRTIVAEPANSDRAGANIEAEARLAADLDTLRQLYQWQTVQKEAFQAAMNGAPLELSLGILVNAVTANVADGRRCAFYVADQPGTGLVHVVGMSQAYARDVNGFSISPESFACGLAIATGQTVVTPDVLEDPRWEDWRWMARAHGFRGCWSFPIETAAGKRVGSFAIYHQGPREPNSRDTELAQIVTQTAAIIISQHQENTRRIYSEERLRALLTATSDAIYWVSADWTEMRTLDNRGLLSDSAASSIAWLDEHILPRDRPQFLAAVNAAIKAKNTFQLEHRVRRSDGTIGYVLSRAIPLLDGKGEITEWFGIATDVTEARVARDARAAFNDRLEAEVAARTAELKQSIIDLQTEREERENAERQLRQAQKMEAIGQLTGGIAHDFNNLLTGIIGSLDLLSVRMAAGRLSGLDQFISAAKGAAQRAASLTHRLLAFSRRQPLDPKPVQVNDLIDGMEDMIRRSLGPSITLEVAKAIDPWTAQCDPNQLENALLNLCLNARDAMSEGGRLIVETANAEFNAHAAKAHELPAGQYIVLSVTDTGTGMAPDVIENAFNPFYTTKPIGQGTGLGLSMVYGFANQSGGAVRIDSKVGEGTAMKLYLPRCHGVAVSDTTESSRPLPSPAQPGEAVLVVDDEPTVRMLLMEVLLGLGYVPIEAPDAAAGLAILQSNVRIDLLITDIGLPGGMNGRQLAEAGRQHRPRLKVLFITGYAGTAILSKDALGPAMQLLIKPFAVDEITDQIASMMGSDKRRAIHGAA